MIYEVIEKHRKSTEEEVEELIKEAKESRDYILLKYTSEYKEKKQKGEVVVSWYRVILTKGITDEKEPERDVSIIYDSGDAF